MRNFKTLLLGGLLLCSLLVVVQPSSGGDFQKFTYWGPYKTMMSAYYLSGLCVNDTTGLQPERYFGQLDSLGVNAAVSWGDSLTTHNPWGVKIIGQDNSIVLSYRDVAYYVGCAHNVYSEVEWNEGLYEDTMNGAWFVKGEGQPYVLNQEDSGWFCDPQLHSADNVLSSRGPKWGTKWFLPTVSLRFKMKVWDNSTTDTVCYWKVTYKTIVGSDTVWTADTTYFSGTSFDIATQWKTFTLPNIRSGSGIYLDLYWNGNDSLAIDKVEMVANGGDWLEDVDGDMLDTAIDSYYSRVNTSNHIFFSPGDEPHAAQFWGQAFFDDHASSRAPYRKSVPALRWRVSNWIHDLEPGHVTTDQYAITVDHDSATNGVTSGSGSSIQTAYNTLTDWIDGFTAVTSPEGIELWQIIQCGAYGSKRDPTTREMKVQIYLSIVHGCTGVGYFTYSQLFDGNCTDEQQSGELVGIQISEFPPDPSKSGSPAFNGLVDWNFDSLWYEPNVRWYAVQEAHVFIDSIWPTLDSLTWWGADSWDKVADINGSIIDRVYSTTFDEDSTFIEVGRFTSGDDYEYYALLNRRSLSSDSQDVMVVYDVGYPAEITEYVSGVVDTVFDSSGVVTSTMHFDPASVKLCRIKPITELAGTCSGNWGEYSTINVTGDITIASGQTLTINTPGLSIAKDKDTLSSGEDSDLIEFIVDGGELRIDGTSSSRISMDPGATSIPNWYGIRVINGGHLYCDNAVIKHAKIGIRIEEGSVDTIQWTRVEDCYDYGI